MDIHGLLKWVSEIEEVIALTGVNPIQIIKKERIPVRKGR